MVPGVCLVKGLRFDSARGENRFAFSTGFLIGQNILATTNHMCENEPVEIYPYPDWTMYEGHILRSDPAQDLAYLEVTRLSLPGYAIPLPPPLTLAGEAPTPRLGETLYAIGRSQKLIGVWKILQGEFLGTQDIHMGELDCIIRGALKIGIIVPHGFSGGPVLNSKNQVVGMMISTDEEASYAVQIQNGHRPV